MNAGFAQDDVRDQGQASVTLHDLSESQCSHEKDDMRCKGIHCLEEYRAHNKCSVLINNIIVLKMAFGPFVASTVNCTQQIFKTLFDGNMNPNTLPNTLVLYFKGLLSCKYRAQHK